VRQTFPANGSVAKDQRFSSTKKCGVQSVIMGVTKSQVQHATESTRMGLTQ
jgi:hypothetical protein